MKNFLKGLTILFAFLLLMNCEKDETVKVHQESIEIRESKFKRLSINDLVKDDETFLELADNYLPNKIGKNGILIKSSTADLIITSDTINVIEKENYISYTIRVKRTGKSYSTENLIIEKNNGISNAYILSYVFDEDWIKEYINGGSSDPRGKAFYSNFDTSNLFTKSSSCTTINVSVTFPCNCGHYIRSQCNGCPTGRQYPYDTVITTSFCNAGGNDEGESNLFTTGENGDTGGLGGGGGPTPNPENSSESQMNMEDTTEFIERQVYSILRNDPNFLLEIDCDEIVKWQNLAQHSASQAIKDKVNALPSDKFNSFAIQTLNGANGTVVNMDYFGVNVATLPKKPNSNDRYTADELIDYFRRNINDFVQGSTFTPYCAIPSICAQETDLWYSNNPTGAIVYIDIPGDDGVVICTDYSSDHWYFQTMEAPRAGNHPVSGTREFGYIQNSNGSYDFFVRGVDRFDSNIVENASYILGGGNPFFGADNLWKSFQTKLDNFVDSNGGKAFKNTPITYRPDWQKVKDVLEGKKPISDLGCNK